MTQRAKKTKGLKGKNVYVSHKDLVIYHAIGQAVLSMSPDPFITAEGETPRFSFTREELEYSLGKLPQPKELPLEEPAAEEAKPETTSQKTSSSTKKTAGPKESAVNAEADKAAQELADA